MQISYDICFTKTRSFFTLLYPKLIAICIVRWNQMKKISLFLNIKFQQTIEACDPLRTKICVWPWPGPERGVPNSAWNTLPDQGHGFPPRHSFPWSGKSVAQVGLRVSCWVMRGRREKSNCFYPLLHLINLKAGYFLRIRKM